MVTSRKGGQAEETRAKRVARMIKELRRERGWSQDKLADEARSVRPTMSRTTVSNAERGLHVPDVETLDSFAVAFGVPVSVLLDGDLFEVEVRRATEKMREMSKENRDLFLRRLVEARDGWDRKR